VTRQIALARPREGLADDRRSDRKRHVAGPHSFAIPNGPSWMFDSIALLLRWLRWLLWPPTTDASGRATIVSGNELGVTRAGHKREHRLRTSAPRYALPELAGRPRGDMCRRPSASWDTSVDPLVCPHTSLTGCDSSPDSLTRPGQAA
jgi:hypothetical protein